MRDGFIVIGLGLLCGLMGVLAQLLVRHLVRRHIPELHLFPTAQLRAEAEKALTLFHDNSDRRTTWHERLRATAVIGLIIGGPYSLTSALGLSFWWAAVISLTCLPLLGAVFFWLGRDELRAAARQRLVRAGVAVCLQCGHPLNDVADECCSTCGAATADTSRLLGAAAPQEAGPSAARGLRPRTALLFMLLLLLVLTVPLPFITQASHKRGDEMRNAWTQIAIPADVTVAVNQADTYGFFVPSASPARWQPAPTANSTPNDLGIELFHESSGVRVPVELPRKSRTDRRWQIDDAEVRIIARAKLTAAGTYRLVASGDPSLGPLYYRPQQMAPNLRLLALLAAPLLVAVVLIAAFAVWQRRHKTSGSPPEGSVADRGDPPVASSGGC